MGSSKSARPLADEPVRLQLVGLGSASFAINSATRIPQDEPLAGMPRVLIVTNMYPTPEHPYYGIFVAEHVNALREQGVGVQVFFTNPRLGRQLYLLDMRRLTGLLRHVKADVLHTQHTYSTIQVAVASQFARSRLPLVMTFHEGEAQLPPGFSPQHADRLKRLVYSKSIKRTALRLADHVVTVDPELPGAVAYCGPYSVIPPGVNLEVFRPGDRNSARHALNLPPDERVLFFPADPRRRDEKGTDLFEAALQSLKAECRVLFGGSIARSDMPTYMNAADVVVQTSRFEASPMVLKEAMACNRPVVSTAVGDVETLTAGVPGCFVAEHNPSGVAAALQRALDFTDQTGGRARLLELGLGLDSVARRYVAIYREASRHDRS